MALYTVITDYAGGTYISQVTAQGLKQVPILWAEKLKAGSIPGVNAKSLATFVNYYNWSQDKPTAIEGVHYVWCVSGIIRGKGLLLNIVRTSTSSRAKRGRH